MVTRRRFLQVGLAATATLALVRALEAAPPASPVSSRALDPRSERVVRALAAVVLSGALPAPPATEAAIARVVEGFERTLSRLDASGREEVAQLLGLLRFGPARVVLAGVWRPLHEASASEIAAFLATWRASRFDLLRAAYQALTQLLQAAWYDDAGSWKRIGYPGPPALDGARAS